MPLLSSRWGSGIRYEYTLGDRFDLRNTEHRMTLKSSGELQMHSHWVDYLSRWGTAWQNVGLAFDSPHVTKALQWKVILFGPLGIWETVIYWPITCISVRCARVPCMFFSMGNDSIPSDHGSRELAPLLTWEDEWQIYIDSLKRYKSSGGGR